MYVCVSIFAFSAGVGCRCVVASMLARAQGADVDGFFELIYLDEFARVGGGHVLGQVPVDSMALPPIIAYATPEIRAKARSL
jgi:hypothetical protein